MWLRCAIVSMCLLHIFPKIACGDPASFFLKASKSVPRIGRSNNNNNKGSSNDDFEKFFLKASKSVPRIGRRDQVKIFDESYLPHPFVYDDRSEYKPNDRKISYPTWSQLAELYENDPQFQALTDQIVDDGTFSDWEKMRFKRSSKSARIQAHY